jgi:hypothetical protein
MKHWTFRVAIFVVLPLLAASTILQAAPQTTNFAGTWQMTMQGGNGRRGGGGGGQAGRGQGRGGAQTLAISKDGEQYKVAHTTPRGENTFNATISGNTISWTETRQGRDGNSISMEYKATVDGDTMQGTVGGGQFNRQFTAKRLTS